MSVRILILFVLLLFIYLWVPAYSHVSAQVCDSATCKACLGYDPIAQRFNYQPNLCTATAPQCIAYSYSAIGPTEAYQLQQNTNPVGTWTCSSYPSGCNQAFNCGDGPTVTPGGGGCPPNCPSPTPTPTPTPYCTLSCSGQGGVGVGGGGGSVTIDETNDYSKEYPESIVAVKISKL